MGVEGRLATVYERLDALISDLLKLLPLLAVALLVILLFWWAARIVGRWRRPFRRLSTNRFVRDLLRQITQGAILVIGVLLALEILDATALIGAVLGTAGVVGLAIGFAFKDLVENYIASVLLSVRQPFAPGDHVVVGDREGKVVRLTSRATILMTLDGNHLRIPNAEVFKGTVLNYTTNPTRRFEFRVGVGVDVDLSPARQTALVVLEEMEGVIEEPPPQVLVEELGDSTVQVVCRGWIDQREADFEKVRGEAIRLVKEGFDADGIAMPEPTYRLQMLEGAPWVQEAPPAPARDGETGDIAVERHLDERIARERASEEDLLTEDAPQE